MCAMALLGGNVEGPPAGGVLTRAWGLESQQAPAGCWLVSGH